MESGDSAVGEPAPGRGGIHPLLSRQLSRLRLDPSTAPGADDDWRTLLARVSRAYESADQDRYLMERSLTISSREMGELYRTVARGEAEQAALRRVATAVAAEAPPEEVFGLVAQQVAAILDADCGFVIRFEGGANGRIAGSWQRPGVSPPPQQVFELTDASATGRVYRTGGPARVDDLAAPEVVPVPGFAGALRASIGAPIRAGAGRWGAVVAANERPGSFPEGAERGLSEFAELAGLAVVNAEARAQLAVRASNDPLTGLANHRTFHEQLAAEADRARRHGRELALALFDLDLFKPVNDRYGHQTGDQVLVETARRLAECARPGDVIARVGGEEFAWLLPECDAFDASEAAERARRAVSEEPFAVVGRITISGGVCELDQARDAGDLYRLADAALYWAKAHGRDVCVRYGPEIGATLAGHEQAGRLERQQALSSVRALARVVDAKDPATRRHSERVAELSVRLATALGWSPVRCAQLHEAGLLHDVGKIGVPDQILLAPGALTADDRAAVAVHPVLGARMLEDVIAVEEVSWVRGHHERWDGAGYPDGLAGEAIPDGARVLAVAEACDAMTSPRAYAPRRSWDEAVAECRREAGGQFDPGVVDALGRLHESGALSEGPGRT
jgi:diguanylate cyclase (GGDEF)-like protein